MFSTSKDKFEELMEAVRKGNKTVVSNILEKNKDLLIDTDDQGQMPIHIAAAEGKTEIVDLLIKFDKSQLTARGREQRTPLYTAALNGQQDVITLLLTKHGDNPNTINIASEMTPLQIAIKKRYYDAAAALVTGGAKVSEEERALIAENVTRTNKIS